MSVGFLELCPYVRDELFPAAMVMTLVVYEALCSIFIFDVFDESPNRRRTRSTLRTHVLDDADTMAAAEKTLKGAREVTSEPRQTPAKLAADPNEAQLSVLIVPKPIFFC